MKFPDLTVEQLQLFLVVVLPGVIAIKVYDLFHPPEKRDFGSSLLEAIAYGLINFSFWAWPLLEINRSEFVHEHPIWYALISFGFLVVSPTALACFVVWARTWRRLANLIGDAPKTAWDGFFKRRQECWILFHMKNGKMVGGLFGASSYVSTYPHPQEIYVEKVYRTDERGVFLEIVEGTNGMLIRFDSCDRLEFLTVERS
jgi:hypothetical protein